LAFQSKSDYGWLLVVHVASEYRPPKEHVHRKKRNSQPKSLGRMVEEEPRRHTPGRAHCTLKGTMKPKKRGAENTM
jgi:hypothetical protein